jgi:hypothetical protein
MVLMRIRIAGFDRFWDTFTTRGKAKRSDTTHTCSLATWPDTSGTRI